MKTSMIKLLIITLCTILCLSACGKNNNDTGNAGTHDDGYDAGYKDGNDAGINNSASSENEELSLSFETVSDLLNAIKKDPYAYANKTIQVKGTLAKCDPILALVEINEPLDSYYGVELRYQIKNNPSIDIKITDDILYTVAEHNDYMQIRGVLKIVNGEIYLDNCTY